TSPLLNSASLSSAAFGSSAAVAGSRARPNSSAARENPHRPGPCRVMMSLLGQRSTSGRSLDLTARGIIGRGRDQTGGRLWQAAGSDTGGDKHLLALAGRGG